MIYSTLVNDELFQITDFTLIISVCTVSVVMTAIMNNNVHFDIFITVHPTNNKQNIQESSYKLESNQDKLK